MPPSAHPAGYGAGTPSTVDGHGAEAGAEAGRGARAGAEAGRGTRAGTGAGAIARTKAGIAAGIAAGMVNRAGLSGRHGR